MTIEEKRRELFEAWCIENHGTMGMPRYPEWCLEKNLNGKYSSVMIQGAWEGFNAALDALAIILPSDPNEEFCDRRAAVDACRAAIESTGLGLKVLP